MPICGNEMATKNRIAYALPIIQIIQILSAKSYKQKCLRLIYRERVGILSAGGARRISMPSEDPSEKRTQADAAQIRSRCRMQPQARRLN